MAVEEHPSQQPDVNRLLKQLIQDVNNLLTQHIELFKYEIKEEVAEAGKYTTIIVAGTLIAYTGLILFGFFLIFALALILPLWAASLAVTIFYFMIAAIVLFITNKRLKKMQLMPEASLEEAGKTVKETQKWLQKKK